MKKTVTIIILITLASKVFGFFREFILSYFYGASEISDAYIISNTIPTSIIAFIGVAIASVYLPQFSKIYETDIDESYKFTDKILTLLIFFSVIIIIFAFFFMDQLINLFAFGFNEETFELTKNFTRITFFSIVFILFTPIFQTLLNREGKYHLGSLSGFPLNFIVIISIVLSYFINIYILPIGIVLGSIFQMLFLYFYVRRTSYKYIPTSFLKDANIKSLIILALPVFFGVAVNQINLIIDRSLASTVAIGGVSAMNYANKINWLIQGAFSTTIATIFFTEASKEIHDKNQIAKKLKDSINDLHIFIVPSMVLCIVFSKEIIEYLFMRGNFDKEALEMTAGPLLFYSIGFIGFAYREIFSRTYYLLKNTKTPVLTALIGMIINVILNFILVKYMGLSGLALATSISALVSSALLLSGLKKSKYEIDIKISFVFRSFLKYTLIFLIPLSIQIILLSSFGGDIGRYFLLISIFSLIIYILILYSKKEIPVKYFKKKQTKKGFEL